jgi:hypothetical protein
MNGFRLKYSQGVSEYYESCSHYSNPHASKFIEIIRRLFQWLPEDLLTILRSESSSLSIDSLSCSSLPSRDGGAITSSLSPPILDLACGSGQITQALKANHVENVVGLDPFLSEQYQKETGKFVWNNSFEDIIEGRIHLPDFSMIICSYGLHLCSNLERLLQVLQDSTCYLCVITPHGLPIIEESTGWKEMFRFKYANVKTLFFTTRVLLEENEIDEVKKRDRDNDDAHLGMTNLFLVGEDADDNS